MPFGFRNGRSSWRSRLRRRSSTGSMPRSRAAMSSRTSRASVSNCHGPRYADRPAVFVYTVVVVNDAVGTRYGPGKSMPTAAAGADRPRRRVGPAVGDEVDVGRRRSCRRRRRRTGRRPAPGGTCPRPAGSRAGPRSTSPGAPTVGRGQHDRHVLALHRDLLAEAAAGVAGDDADAVLGDAEQARAEQAPLVRGLRGGVDREVAAGGVAARRRGRGTPSAPRRSACWWIVSRATWAAPAKASSSASVRRPGMRADDVRAVRGVHQVARRRRRTCSRRRRAADRRRPRRDRPRPRRRSGSSARTRATGSPTKRTSSPASGGRGVSGLCGPDRGVPLLVDASGSRSAAVSTQRTPGSAAAAATSMPRTVARASGLRTKQACSMPGRETSSTKVPRPVRRRASSMRGTRAPA